MNKKIKVALYLTPEKREKLERLYTADGSRTMTDFIEKAIDFYSDSLFMSNAGALLPRSISAVIEGRLGMFEDRISSLLFKQTVELSMIMRILAQELDINEVDLNSLRGKCVADVKRTNGHITFSDILKQRRSL